MVISKYGFADLLGLDHVALDPSRIAAQIVSGIGFITVCDIDVTREDLDDDGSRVAAVTLQLAGRGGNLGDLAGELAELPGVHTAHTGPTDHE
jgi:hypothetical protein